MMYMRAHGNSVQRGYRAWQSAAVAGFLAGWPALLLAWRTNGLAALVALMHLSLISMSLVGMGVMVLAGAAYGFMFPRAGADLAGCWLFGLAYGFLIWLIFPGALMPLVVGHPVAVGVAAAGLMFACLAYGLFVGILYPLVLRLLMKNRKPE